MAWGESLSGLGAGMVRGLELARRHDREDARAIREDQLMDMREREFERSEERFGLDMENARRGAEIRETTFGRTQEQWAQQDEDRARAEQERARKEWLEDGRVAMLAAKSGDVDGLNAWLGTNPDGEQAMVQPNEDGTYTLMYSPGGDEMLERTMTQQELPTFINAITGQAAPKRSTKEVEGYLVDEQTGEVVFDGNSYGAGEGGLRPRTGELDSSVLSHIRSTAGRFHGTFDPASNSWVVDPASRQRYVTAMNRAEQLYRKGLDLGQAVEIGNLSVIDAVDQTDARAQAQKEAADQGFSIGDGDRKAEWIEKRTAQIMDEANSARRVYQQYIGGAGTETPALGAPAMGGGNPSLGGGGLSLTPQDNPQEYAMPDAKQGGYSGTIQRDPNAPAPATAPQGGLSLTPKTQPVEQPAQPNGNGAPAAPAPGTVMNGYEFMGGNPADKNNWKKVTQ